MSYARKPSGTDDTASLRRLTQSPQGLLFDYGVRLATGHHAEVSTLSGRVIVSTLIRPITEQLSLFPRSFTRCTVDSPYGVPSFRGNSASGLPCYAPMTGSTGVPSFRRWCSCQRISTKQRDNRPLPILGQAQTLWPVWLYDDSDDGSLMLTRWTSLAPHRMRLPVTCTTPRGILHTPQGGYIVRALSTTSLPTMHRS